MPNWNFNGVVIKAPIEEVEEYLVEQDGRTYFNMHKIFPNKFPPDDEAGLKNYEYDWACDHTDSKWFPEIDECRAESEACTRLMYDTAWVPNNGTLLKLSEVSGWEITNQYEEGGSLLAGTFNCYDGEIYVDEEQEYLGTCGCCEERFAYEELVGNDKYSFLCQSCVAKLDLKIHCTECNQEVFHSNMDDKTVFCPSCKETFPRDEAFAS